MLAWQARKKYNNKKQRCRFETSPEFRLNQQRKKIVRILPKLMRENIPNWGEGDTFILRHYLSEKEMFLLHQCCLQTAEHFENSLGCNRTMG